MKNVRGVLKFLGALLIVLTIAMGYVYWRTGHVLAQHLTVSEPPLAIPTGPDAVARGEHIAITHTCADCHGADMAGNVIVDAFPIGRIAGPNLTRGKGGDGARLDARALELAIRHGLAADGRMLLYMPAHDYSSLTDADTADLIAYITALPAIDREVPPAVAGPLARVLFLLGKMPLVEALQIDQQARHVAHVDVTPTAEYGAYLAMTACSGCHGTHFSGGHVPGSPPSFRDAQNLTPDPGTGIGRWSKVDFYTAVRLGMRPDGSTIDEFMPWQAFARLSDTELDALWVYLQTLPARPQGQR